MLVTNEVVAPAKIARLAALAQSATIGVLVDNASVIADLSAAAAMAGGTLHALCRDRRRRASLRRRAGVRRQWHSPARLRLHRRARAFADCMRIHGAAQHLRTPAERSAGHRRRERIRRETQGADRMAGVPCPVVTGAGTGTWQLERDSGVYTELQPGSYIFTGCRLRPQCARVRRARIRAQPLCARNGDERAGAERAIVDAGLKALAFDSGTAHRARGARSQPMRRRPSEHGVLPSIPPRAAPVLSDRVWLIPGHCDPTVNLYDWIVGMRGERVECDLVR